MSTKNHKTGCIEFLVLFLFFSMIIYKNGLPTTYKVFQGFNE